MSGEGDWYSAQYGSEPTAENPFGLSALKLSEQREMQAFFDHGGTMLEWLLRKEAQK